ncbi:MAG: phosphotransferase [Burkholderiales bacterium]|nr:phosphotransferase [Burkholderiales bacterium]
MADLNATFVGTTAVRAQHRFDEAVLEAYLAARIPGFRGPMSVEQFKGGQSNPTYRIAAGGRQYVLRRKPPGKLLPSAHAVDREYAVMTALGNTDVPVPKTWLLCTDETVIGTAFFVMDCVPGRIFWEQSLPGMAPAERGAIYDEMNRVIAALHSVDFAAIGLSDYGRPGNYFARQIKRWSEQYRASETERIEAMDNLIAWLPENIPGGDETSIVHGDFRLDNMIFHPTEPRVLAVLDWELSTLGHPLADFSYHCMSWQILPGEFRGIAGLDHAALGIPSEDEYIASYCRRTGRAGIEHWHFYLAFSFFRIAAILQGIAKRALEGTAASAQAVETGKRARPMAEMGWSNALRVLRQPESSR